MAEAEKRLFQDNMLFDDFLQETHQAASEAMAQADAQAQKHKEKCKKIKQVNCSKFLIKLIKCVG